MDNDLVEVVAREIGPTIRASILRGGACSHEEIDAVISGFAHAAIAAYEAASAARIRELEEALKPFAAADRAVGNERGPFRFETGTGFREIDRDSLRRARAAYEGKK